MKQGLKKICGCFLILIMAFPTGACSTQHIFPSDHHTGGQQQSAVKTLSLLMYTDWYNSGWNALEKYINTNPGKLGFKLDIQKIAGGDQGNNILTVKIASDDLPDLLQYYGPSWIDVNCNGLDKIVELDGLESLNQYDQNIIDAEYRYKGKLYAMPIGETALMGVFYNKKIFSNLGLSIPQNWDEFLQTCENIKNAGITPVFYAGKDIWTLQTVAHMGFTQDILESGKSSDEFWKLINTNKRKYIDNKNFIDMIQKSKDLIDLGYVNSTYLNDSWDDAQKALVDGTAAMHICGNWVISLINTKYPDEVDGIGAFPEPMPNGDNYVNMSLPTSISITTNCKDIDLGKKALDYIVSKEAQQIYVDAQPGLYLNREIKNHLPSATEDLKEVMDSGKVMKQWQSNELYPYGQFEVNITKFYIGEIDSAEEVVRLLDTETGRNAKAKGDPNWEN